MNEVPSVEVFAYIPWMSVDFQGVWKVSVLTEGAGVVGVCCVSCVYWSVAVCDVAVWFLIVQVVPEIDFDVCGGERTPRTNKMEGEKGEEI